jgi:glycosyltransferase involved in cell wall biosynthesis
MSTIISLVSYPFLPARLGGQKGIALFYKYFSRHCRLLCITTQKNDPAAAEGYQVINSISDSPLRYINFFLLFPISSKIKKEKAGHFILEHPYYGWLGILLKKTTHAKMVVHAHNIEYTRWKSLSKPWWPILKWYEKQTMCVADYVFFKTSQDREHAAAMFGLHPEKTVVITYGIEWNSIPAEKDILASQQKLQQIHHLDPGTRIFLFNGSLDYAPNLQAVKTILDIINPLLMENNLVYKIIICGRGLPAEMNELKAYADKHIIYAGFVDDIAVYFRGADVFINPVTDGGGIKTKLVEALGYNLNVVSTESGAMGVPVELTGTKMKVLKDDDWNGFAKAMGEELSHNPVPGSFFEHFYWENIAAKAYGFINGNNKY